MTDYNYSNFEAAHYALTNFQGPEVGSRAPDFTLKRVDGSETRLLDFSGQFLVLEMGSITCPLFQSRRRGMARLLDDFPDVAQRILYVREAHPGANIPAHGSPEEKTSRAAQLRDRDAEGREILIDTMQGAAHDAYGGFPNSVYIVNRNGCIVYRSTWSNPRATRRALTLLMAGKSLRPEGYFLPAFPPVAVHTLRQAGRGSAVDFLRSLPSMFWKNMIRHNLMLIFGQRRKIRPDASC